LVNGILDNELWIEDAFEFKNYAVRNVPVATLLNTRLNRLKKNWESLGGDTNFLKVEIIHFDGKNILERLQHFEQIQKEHKIALYNSHTYNDIRFHTEHLIYAENAYEIMFLEEYDAINTSDDSIEVKVQEKLDTGVLIRSMQNPTSYPEIQKYLIKEKNRILKKRLIGNPNV